MSQPSAKPIPGVYQFAVGDDSVFVGNSDDMQRRVRQHAEAGLISHDYADFIIKKMSRRRFFRRR